jgi:hypothetical protein
VISSRLRQAWQQWRQVLDEDVVPTTAPGPPGSARAEGAPLHPNPGPSRPPGLASLSMVLCYPPPSCEATAAASE